MAPRTPSSSGPCNHTAASSTSPGETTQTTPRWRAIWIMPQSTARPTAGLPVLLSPRTEQARYIPTQSTRSRPGYIWFNRDTRFLGVNQTWYCTETGIPYEPTAAGQGATGPCNSYDRHPASSADRHEYYSQRSHLSQPMEP
ncbi:hypothetical protein QBC37DRAFT_400576 [Rhypophila decipiens]|uniref:Uncharacterized protein n=1 Tax=Rhypophila decipiens TaxID=261697 RepID=A0AAN7B9U5_9PEZI|nr:hypothetical protein QBC37DRAFT_400576 [Rhypophila decipiens]